MLAGYIQACRGLMITAVCLGFFGTVFALVGMKCTKIGGSKRIKARIACLAGVNFILSGKCNEITRVLIINMYLNSVFIFFSGLCSLSSCSIYAHQITSEFFDPLFVEQK